MESCYSLLLVNRSNWFGMYCAFADIYGFGYTGLQIWSAFCMDYITISCCIYCIYIDCYTGIKSLLLSISAYPFLVMDFTPCFLFLIISWPCSFPWLCCILHSWHCAMLLDIYICWIMPLYFLIRSFVQDSI